MPTTEKIREFKVGGRRLRAGDVVRVKEGSRFGEFRILYFSADGAFVDVYGGKPGRARLQRTFAVDRLGVRIAAAGSEKALQWS